MKALTANFKGEVERHSDALTLLSKPGDMVLVTRGGPRLLVFACPDGCGDVIPVNLDARAGKAWRYYKRGDSHTLYPSVWRDQGCRAHFILWANKIYWSGFGSDAQPDRDLIKAVASELNKLTYRPYVEIALQIDEIPWAVLIACKELVRKGVAEEALGRDEGLFKLRK